MCSQGKPGSRALISPCRNEVRKELSRLLKLNCTGTAFFTARRPIEQHFSPPFLCKRLLESSTFRYSQLTILILRTKHIFTVNNSQRNPNNTCHNNNKQCKHNKCFIDPCFNTLKKQIYNI